MNYQWPFRWRGRAKAAFIVMMWGAVCGTASAQDAALSCGSATLRFDLPALLSQTPLAELDAVFGIAESRDQLLTLPGNMPAAVVTWDLNPVAPISPIGRTLQATTLLVSPTDILGTWQAGTDLGPFLVGGEQIGFGGMTRFTLDPGINGILLFGDWALRYAPGRSDGLRSGLVLTSNIDFAHAVFADIGDLHLSLTNSTLEISGNLLVSDGLIALGFPATNYLLPFGEFSLTACLTNSDVTSDGFVDVEDLYAWEQGAGALDVDADGAVTQTDRDALSKVIRCNEARTMVRGRD